MLGRLNPDHKEAVVIGAGYAGLLTAYRLIQAGYKVIIHERSNRTGGLISTLPTEFGNVETAAHSIRSSPEVLQLFTELDLPYVAQKSKKKFIFRDGKLKSNPFTLFEMFSAASFAAFKKSDGQLHTLADWTSRHLGALAVGSAISPLAHGIYAASPEELDQTLAFPRFSIPAGLTFVQKMMKAKGPKERSFVMAPRDGMGALINRLAEFVGDKGTINLNSEITSLPDNPNIIIATTAPIAGKLIGHSALENIRYAPMVTTTVFIKKSDLPDIEGIGVLMARGEDTKILGVLFNSATFDNRVQNDNLVSLTVMLGGTGNPDILQKTNAEIADIIQQELHRVLGLKSALQGVFINRWPNAIPLYSATLRETLDALKAGWAATSGHILAGNYTGEVSIRGMCQSTLALTES